MSKQKSDWPYVTLNVRRETRTKVLALTRAKPGPTKKFERTLESVDEIINRLVDEHNGGDKK